MSLGVLADHILGKGEIFAIPSPLPRGDRFFPIHRRARFGPGPDSWRPRPEYPFRGIVRFDLRGLEQSQSSFGVGVQTAEPDYGWIFGRFCHSFHASQNGTGVIRIAMIMTAIS
uniref:Uncharacterized protein n=1 Tax=Candidatus Kentrum sp. SD TaxID=2126332 RepID=A0A450YQK5_9GAMM|nr:MAG: hypothetical protein BECKSD772F_GA0070984_10317 [Candidatus Kentron sp. SD]VFK43828.1 MAG: hypothetical protein BECKSD772E_GA0070983_10307 [Candidatus Kentron sp. SD]